MKKSIKIASLGVAALGFAAMPVAGVFASDNVDLTDTVTVTIGDNCSFTKATSGDFTADMTVTDLEEFGTNASTYKVICNNSDGYTVTASFDGMTSNDTEDTIPYSTSNPAAGTSAWGAYIDSGSTPVASSATVKQSSAATTSAGETFVAKYKVSTDNIQEQGTYSGTATYTFAQKQFSV